MDSPAILTVPCCETGHGGGHLTRCISLVKDLRAVNREALLYIPKQLVTAQTENLFKSMNLNLSWLITDPSLVSLRLYRMIILDRFKTPLDELLYWKKIAPVIGIDEGGSFRDNFDFLIDILIPEKIGKPHANTADPSLLKFPSNSCRKDKKNDMENNAVKVLITFGQEDPSNLGLKTARTLSAKSEKHSMEITLLRGSLSKHKDQLPPKIQVIDAIPMLAEHLHEYDLVITHYGITAYEAFFAGTPVILDHPTSLHKKLSKAAGFYDIKYLNLFLKSITKQHQSMPASVKLQSKMSLAELCSSFSPQVNRQCPVCGAKTGRGAARFNDRTYRRCSECGIIYMDRICPPPIEYSNEYFFESYKKQYGKTYLEDFNSIKETGKRRIKTILKLSRKYNAKKPSLLDIGCAYGPFLLAAQEEGFLPAGIDTAEDAVCYVQKELGIPAIQGFFPVSGSSFLIPDSYNVITLWYVMEHFQNCISALTEIRKLLKPGGMLAFSTPSFSGISGRKNLRDFLSASPADHYTVWSPKMCRKALTLAGFKVKKTVVSGHHPERFPLLGKFADDRKSPVYRVLLTISRLFGLGDTFEVYAQIKENI